MMAKPKKGLNLSQQSMVDTQERMDNHIISAMREEHISYEKVLDLIKNSNINVHISRIRLERMMLWEMQKDEEGGG